MAVLKIPRSVLFLGTSLVFLSCSEEKIRTYRLATDDSENAEVKVDAPAVVSGDLRWQAPESWKVETPGQFQTALYRLGSEAQVSVSSLPGDAGGEAANVNRWRQQIGLEAVDDVGGETLAVEGGEMRARWFELVGAEKSILAAIISLKDATWFFKLNSPTSELAERRDEFTTFLTSIHAGSAKPPVATTPAPNPAKPNIDVEVPEGWEKSEGSAMRVASFRIPAEEGTDGDVSVIPLFGEAGSTLENVNRWRGQLKLAALESEDDPEIGTMMDGASGPLLMTHMVSEEGLFEGDKPGAISTGIFKAGDFTWFFKLAGEADLVRENRDKFEAFVRSAKVP